MINSLRIRAIPGEQAQNELPFQTGVVSGGNDDVATSGQTRLEEDVPIGRELGRRHLRSRHVDPECPIVFDLCNHRSHRLSFCDIVTFWIHIALQRDDIVAQRTDVTGLPCSHRVTNYLKLVFVC